MKEENNHQFTLLHIHNKYMNKIRFWCTIRNHSLDLTVGKTCAGPHKWWRLITDRRNLQLLRSNKTVIRSICKSSALNNTLLYVASIVPRKPRWGLCYSWELTVSSTEWLKFFSPSLITVGALPCIIIFWFVIVEALPYIIIFWFVIVASRSKCFLW